ncbi:nucleolar RNA-binding protein, truncated [Trypanosoma brucei gambiense DAL972]|uniref:Nucleolar RNA-binding protein, truncated n=1 Tax=Trypanosoma brucei gambiense (strain MHOM/CI/86/DAL972) TaxID=679716 RepID=C9ZUJ4_TRYB9|nr:nucleolar RNA-binding protein, truncated [Trypanosoma brucei gambiense DAL972]CBH13082.1 nucleolar RNA-binding protein, truncated [Trypanosoma brucei gambiense DAL972]|eukprot:XP_011775359.1 nucleolar RNA-binding protein, truncated [Trypanosoma brucei gambiense DAL972]
MLSPLSPIHFVFSISKGVLHLTFVKGFYGVEVSAGQKVKPKIPEDHVLRLTQIAVPANASGAITLVISFKGKEFTIATLDPKRSLFQMGIDLVLTAEQGTTLSATGSGSVHLTLALFVI